MNPVLKREEIATDYGIANLRELVYHKPRATGLTLEQLTEQDETILRVFLEEEQKADPLFEKYKQWKTLTGDPTYFNNIKGKMLKAHEKAKKIPPNLKMIARNNRLWSRICSELKGKYSIDSQILKELQPLLSTPHTRYHLEEGQCLSFVAYAKERLSEQTQGQLDYEPLRSVQFREEIYRSVFSQRESFEGFSLRMHQLYLFERTCIVYPVTLHEETLTGLREKHPVLALLSSLVLWISKRGMKNVLIPEEVFDSYVKDYITTLHERADRIYGV